MQLNLLIGLQASGKSTFARAHMLDAMLYLSLDVLRTRHRERLLFEAGLASKTKMVIDNTNATCQLRARYLRPAIAAGYRVVGYYFAMDVQQSLQRNQQRALAKRIPEVGILGTYKQFEVPSFEEGFTELNYVTSSEGAFQVEAWQ